MQTKTLQQEISRKSTNPETIAARVVRQPGLLREIFKGLDADTARVKYGSLKVLRILSEKSPATLYPEIDRFFQLLDSENTILKWGAIIIIGNLAAVDSDGKIDGALDRYLKPIPGPVMITANNVIGGAGRIALAKPHLADRIARALLQVEIANYQTAECRNVSLGCAIDALGQAFENLREPQPIIEFVKHQLRNSRNAVRKKAARFLERHGGDSINCRMESRQNPRAGKFASRTYARSR